MLTGAISICLKWQYLSHCGKTEASCCSFPIVIAKTNCSACQMFRMLLWCTAATHLITLARTKSNRQLLHHETVLFTFAPAFPFLLCKAYFNLVSSSPFTTSFMLSEAIMLDHSLYQNND